MATLAAEEKAAVAQVKAALDNLNASLQRLAKAGVKHSPVQGEQRELALPGGGKVVYVALKMGFVVEVE